MSGIADSSLRPLLEPRSVAVVGASQDATRIGGRVLSYLISGGFRGRIVPVNANRREVQGLPAYPDIGSVEGSFEAAILALPAGLTVNAVRDCAARGVKACIVFSSGFAETSTHGRDAQDELSAIARTSGMRILGPNCLGLFTAHTGFYGSFSNTLDRAMPAPGPLSIVSQSGAFGTHLYYVARERGLGLRYWISTGNEADIQAAECVAAIADDPQTRVILLYLEGVRDGRMLTDALEKARVANKPVLAVKVGRSQVGAQAAASHTAALAGSDAVFDAVFQDHGVWRADSAEEAVDVAYAAAQGIFPSGRRLGIVTISGGGGILMADVAASHGLEVAPMPQDAQNELVATLPFAAPRNPVDMTAQAFNEMDLFARSLDLVVSRGGYDAVAAFLTTVPGSAAIRPKLRATLSALRKDHPGKLIVPCMAVPTDILREYEEAGFPIFEDANRAIRAIAALAYFSEAFARKPEPDDASSTVRIPQVPTTANESEALKFLSAAGLRVVPNRLCRDAADVASAFRELTAPVVMKICSVDIPHKTEIGGVIVGIANEATALEGYAALMRRANEQRPDARLDGVLMTNMIGGHIEAILGVQRDPVFGPVVMVGLGGIHAEIFRDTQIAIAPVRLDKAFRMIEALRCYPLFEGARGGTRRDVPALAAMIVRLSEIATVAAGTLESIDINPVAVLAEGQGCLALDASVFGRETPSAMPKLGWSPIAVPQGG